MAAFDACGTEYLEVFIFVVFVCSLFVICCVRLLLCSFMIEVKRLKSLVFQWKRVTYFMTVCKWFQDEILQIHTLMLTITLSFALLLSFFLYSAFLSPCCLSVSLSQGHIKETHI